MIRVTTLACLAIISASPLAAQEFGATPAGALICQDESGCRNVPNYHFDPAHTAGGHFQITDTNWRHYAPQLDIDLDKFPNAMSASEQLQGQVAGKMWAEQGFLPWVPYNRQLREHLNQQTALVKVRRAHEKPDSPASEPPPHVKAEAAAHNWNVFAADAADSGGQSFLITGESQ